MRTLGDIITLAKDGGKPTYDELLYGLLALDGLHHFDHQFIIELPEEPMYQQRLSFWAEESFNRVKLALNKSPKEWLGWEYDPANPEYQRQRKMALRLVDKFMGGEEPCQKHR